MNKVIKALAEMQTKMPIQTVFLVLIKSPTSLDNIKTDAGLFYSIAFACGLASGLIGPAGGAFIIPIFVAYLRYPITNTIGTTSALSIATTLAGVICYIVLIRKYIHGVGGTAQ